MKELSHSSVKASETIQMVSQAPIFCTFSPAQYCGVRRRRMIPVEIYLEQTGTQLPSSSFSLRIFFLFVTASRDNVHELSLQTILLPQLFPFGPLLAAFGCCWLTASFCLSTVVFVADLVLVEKSFFCFDDPAVTWPFLEKSREKHMNAWFCTCSPVEQGLCTRPNVIFFTSKWDEEGDVLSPNWIFPLLALSIPLPIWETKIFLEGGLAYSFCILIFFKMNSWVFCHLWHNCHGDVHLLCTSRGELIVNLWWPAASCICLIWLRFHQPSCAVGVSMYVLVLFFTQSSETW